MLSSEETPFLESRSLSETEDDYLAPEAKYDRFSPRQKRVIVALVSCCGLLPLFIASSFIPLIPHIVDDLNSSASVISLTVSISMAASGIGGLTGSSYSTSYGRRRVYLFGTALLTIGSLGVSTARSVPSLFFFRFFQVVGASPGLSVGAGVIGDIYEREQRGFAMGIFFAATLVGPTLAPLAGGLAAHYASWRSLQLVFASAGVAVWLAIFLLFPETNQAVIEARRSNSRTFRFINPLKPLTVLKNPAIFIVVSLSPLLTGVGCLWDVWSVNSISLLALLSPLAYTIVRKSEIIATSYLTKGQGVRYNITNAALLGACFLPNGLGCVVGAPISGRMSDAILAASRRRGEAWVPQDRLKCTLLPAMTIVPLSVLIFGLAVEFIPGRIGLTICLTCLLVNGIGAQMVMGPSSAYYVDILPARSAEAVAATNAFRNVTVSATLTIVLPMIEAIGMSWTYTFFAVLGWMSYAILWGVVRYGDKRRGQVVAVD